MTTRHVRAGGASEIYDLGDGTVLRRFNRLVHLDCAVPAAAELWLAGPNVPERERDAVRRFAEEHAGP